MEGSFPKLKLLASNTHDLHKDIVLYFKTNQQIPKGHRHYHQITLTGWSVGIVIFLDFHSTKQGLPLVDSWSRGLDLNQMYPDRDTLAMYPARDTLQHVIKAWWKAVWQKEGKTQQISFSSMNTTQRRGLKLKSNDFSSYPRRETAASGW